MQGCRGISTYPDGAKNDDAGIACLLPAGLAKDDSKSNRAMLLSVAEDGSVSD